MRKLIMSCSLVLLFAACDKDAVVNEQTDVSSPELPTQKFIDLSAKATANCYVVSAPGLYSFKASVRGNGIGDEASAGYDPQISAGEMKADWLWTSTDKLVSDITYDKSTGRISFIAAKGEGNVVIALMNANEVVWSWHIWMTDEPQTMTYENGTTFQDRNLGAIGLEQGSAEAYGLYYQWGRKDPFVGGTTTETSATAFAEAKKTSLVNPLYEGLTWIAATGTLSTFADAVSHPMTFIFNKIGATSTYDWLGKPKQTLWGKKKTLNDPCPPGYKVPEVSAWSNLVASYQYIDGISAWDGDKYGMTYTQAGKTAWYPAQGYRNQSNGNLVGLGNTRSGNYWSSEATSQMAKFFYFQKKLTSSSGSINIELDKNRSFGYSVRCCKE